MGIESSLKNFMRDKEESIKNSSNPDKRRKQLENFFRGAVKEGRIVLLPKGGYEGSKESQAGAKEMYGTRDEPSEFSEALAKKFQEHEDYGKSGRKVTARGLAGQKFGYFPTGKKKGGKAKASKYAKGGGVRKSKYSL